MAFLVGNVSAPEPLVGAEARVVHQDADGPGGIGQSSGDPRAAIVRDEVSGHYLDVDAVLVHQHAANRAEAVGVPSHENKVTAFGR